MKRWSSRRVFTLLLGVFLALGMSLSVVQASDMTAKMAMTSGMSDSGQGGCDACGGGDGNTNAGTCMPMCTAGHGPAVVFLGSYFSALHAVVSSVSYEGRCHGLASAPDPYPPRSIDLG